MNGSTIIQHTNDKSAYANITMYNIENARVSNGILVGDRNSHIYNQENGITHEDGYGISIIACNNIEVNNIEIYDMTGDGINIYGINKGEKISRNITIENNNIYDCRRQGITIGCGIEISIKNNEIHDIMGTNPQAAIDLEGNFQSEEIDKIIIKNNKVYNLGANNAFLLVGFIKNVELNFNQIERDVVVYDAKENIKMEGNYIKNGIVKMSNDYTNINAGHNINNFYFQNNKLENSSLQLSKVKNAEITNNLINNGNIKFISSNGVIKDNKLINIGKEINIALELSNISGHIEKYTAQILNNNIEGNYVEKIVIDGNYYEVTH